METKVATVHSPRIARHQLSGIGDEAGASLQRQINAQQRLGWSRLELREIEGVRLDRLDDVKLNEVANEIDAAGLDVHVIASTIGDWSGTICDDFDADLRQLTRLFAVCERLEIKYIRIMSYPAGPACPRAWRSEVLRRVAELSRRATAQGVVLLHENCHGWAGAEADRALTLIEHTAGSGLRLLFDIGNGVAHGYDGYRYLEQILPWVAHVHVKDAVRNEPDGKVNFSSPGEGEARLLDCIDLLLDSGYRGVFSIEPHTEVRIHESMRCNETAIERSYIKYGQDFMALLGNRLALDSA